MAILRGISHPAGMFITAFFFYSLNYTATALIDNGKLVSLNGLDYWAGGIAASELSPSRNINWNWSSADIVPLTIVKTNWTIFSSKELEKTITEFQSSDDVFSPGFMEGLLISPKYD